MYGIEYLPPQTHEIRYWPLQFGRTHPFPAPTITMTLSHQRVLLSASALIWCSSCDRVVVGPNGDSQLLAPLTLPVITPIICSF